MFFLVKSVILPSRCVVPTQGPATCQSSSGLQALGPIVFFFGMTWAPINGRKYMGNMCFFPPISWVVPPPRMPVANEGLGWDPLLKMVHNPGGDSYWEGGQPNL